MAEVLATMTMKIMMTLITRKLLLLLIKYIPIIQMVGILISNTLYYYEDYTVPYLLDFVVGNSLSFIILQYITSYVFKFCTWHRIIITSNLINLIMVIVDTMVNSPVEDVELLLSYYISYLIFILIAVYKYYYDKENTNT